MRQDLICCWNSCVLVDHITFIMSSQSAVEPWSSVSAFIYFRSMVRKQHGRIQWSGWGIRCPGLQLNRTRPNSFTSLRQPLAPILLQHSSPVTKGTCPTRTHLCPHWSSIHWWVSSTTTPEPLWTNLHVLWQAILVLSLIQMAMLLKLQESANYIESPERDISGNPNF